MLLGAFKSFQTFLIEVCEKSEQWFVIVTLPLNFRGQLLILVSWVLAWISIHYTTLDRKAFWLEMGTKCFAALWPNSYARHHQWSAAPPPSWLPHSQASAHHLSHPPLLAVQSGQEPGLLCLTSSSSQPQPGRQNPCPTSSSDWSAARGGGQGSQN